MVVAVIVALVAFAGGLGVALAVVLRRQHDAAVRLAGDLRAESQAERDATVQSAIDTVIRVANERLAAHTSAAAGELDLRKGLIDQHVGQLRADLEKVASLVQELERDRSVKFGELTRQLTATGEQTAKLADTTVQLREALSSTNARGQWGERMAEDVLQLAGFLEGVNYHKQKAIEGGGIPDFTFLLPRGMCLHMDVKFPLSNYLRYLEADSDADRERRRKEFLRDVRARIKELTTRDYIDPERTVDCVLLFIPNEQLYAFIQEHDNEVLDIALRSKVVLCSPLTLFAVLAVIRQAADNFRLERTSNEILALLGAFTVQWGKFTDQLETLGTHIERTQKAYDTLAATRRRQLERPLDKLEDLRRERNIEIAGDRVIELPKAANS